MPNNVVQKRGLVDRLIATGKSLAALAVTVYSIETAANVGALAAINQLPSQNIIGNEYLQNQALNGRLRVTTYNNERIRQCGVERLSRHLKKMYKGLGVEIDLVDKTPGLDSSTATFQDTETRRTEFLQADSEYQAESKKANEEYTEYKKVGDEAGMARAYARIETLREAHNRRVEEDFKYVTAFWEAKRANDRGELVSHPLIYAAEAKHNPETDGVLLRFYDNDKGILFMGGNARVRKGTANIGDDVPCLLLGDVLGHEIGHLLGLEHAVLPNDVMSYGVSSYIVSKLYPELSFTPESKRRWEEIRRKHNSVGYDDSDSSKVQKPKSSAMQFVGSPNEFKFYEEHGYPKTPPKKLGMKRR